MADPTAGPVMTVSEAGWVDTGTFKPNRGTFPIQVERHLNSFVAAHLPGVTTVTTGTRYYALHGLLAHIAEEESLEPESARHLLRRSEALLACVTRVHHHDGRFSPAPHGIDAIMGGARTDNGFDLARAAEVYSRSQWAYANTYRGPEQALKILGTKGFATGPSFDLDRAASVLAPLVSAARATEEVTEADLQRLSAACLCTTADSPDGAWLAELLSGDRTEHASRLTMGQLLWQFGRLATRAMEANNVTGATDLSDLIMFDQSVRTDPELARMVAPARWRGGLLRRESVFAWRLIWRYVNQLVGGSRAVSELVDAFADELPSVDVQDFKAALPARLWEDGSPRPAERELDHLSPLERWMARLFLGADRLSDLHEEELRGFCGRQEDRGGIWEELSPGWVADRIERSANRTMRDLGRDFAMALINRSQRVALYKSGFNSKTGVFTFPARLHVRDGIAVQIFSETATDPATRIPQYLSLARQAGMFSVDATGRYAPGPNGGLLV
ncbi:hypothetical protein ACSDQ9_09195 [Aestuariimicrobium soli]|uniref:hypothetical protein n=1 Tax=Aestuariimicrobium soli TaxID=2035834 RepID=UPI003EBCC972